MSLYCAQGEDILKRLAQVSGKLTVRIAVNTPTETQPQDDIRLLKSSGEIVCVFVRAWVCCHLSSVNICHQFGHKSSGAEQILSYNHKILMNSFWGKSTLFELSRYGNRWSHLPP